MSYIAHRHFSTLHYIKFLCLYMSYRLRAQFAVEGSEINALHGSSSVEDATKEIQKFFPVENTVAVIKPSAMTEKGENKIVLCCTLASSPWPVYIHYQKFI